MHHAVLAWPPRTHTTVTMLACLRTLHDDDDVACVYRPSGLSVSELESSIISSQPGIQSEDIVAARHGLDTSLAGISLVAKTRDASCHLSGLFGDEPGLQYEVQRKYREENPFAVERVHCAILLGNAWEAGAAASDEDENSRTAFAAAVDASAADDALASLDAGAWRWAWRRWDHDAHPTKAGAQRLLDLHSTVDGFEVQTTLEVLSVSRHPSLGALSHVRMTTDTTMDKKSKLRSRALDRTHQMRLHTAALGCPIVGDSAYWPVAAAVRTAVRHEPPPQSWRSRTTTELVLANCAAGFDHPISGAQVRVAVAEPPCFAALLSEGAQPEGLQYEVRQRFLSDNGFYQTASAASDV